MNEKTKQILRYVACGLGGLALGIGLLGGLSMCATSANKKTETVNTILTNERVRHNELITTENGGYTGYSFTLNEEWSTSSAYINWRVYDVDPSTYTLTLFQSGGNAGGDTQTLTKAIIENVYETYIPSGDNALRFLAVWQRADWWNFGYLSRMAYFSFILPNGQTTGYLPKAFVKIGWDEAWGVRFDEDYFGWNEELATPYFVTYEQSNIILFDTRNIETDPVSSLTFQDVESYYGEAGYSEGHTAGYAEGYEAGETVGYGQGYADGYTDGADNTLLFTKLGANQTSWSLSDISWDASTDTTSTMKCLDFKDGENNTYYVNLVDYTSGGGEVQINVYKNGTSSNNFYATIGRGNYNRAFTEIDIIPSSYLEFDFAQVITYYHNAIPNNWFMLSGTPANANGYQQGYQAGYRDGQMSTPSGQATDNVFSLFTSAFNSIGGIFEMKIFGFLPLYWFFLTPIFIAIITLLLRMVKH